MRKRRYRDDLWCECQVGQVRNGGGIGRLMKYYFDTKGSENNCRMIAGLMYENCDCREGWTGRTERIER